MSVEKTLEVNKILRDHEEKVESEVELRLTFHLYRDDTWRAEVTELCDGWTGQLPSIGRTPNGLLEVVIHDLPDFLDYYIG